MKKITILILLLVLNTWNSVAQFPFPEEFEDEVFPPMGWIVSDNSVVDATKDWTYSTDEYSGSRSAFISFENASATTQDWLITPQFTPTASANKLTFYQKQAYTTDYGSSYTIRVSDGGFALEDFVDDIYVQAEASFGTSYTMYSVDLSAYNGIPIYLAFVLGQDDGDSWFIDNVSLVDPVIPSNDECVNAISIESAGYENTQEHASGTTNNSGVISVTDCGFGMNDGVWYTFQSENAGTITIDITNVSSTFDVEVALYSGSSCGSFVCVDNADANLDGESESITASIGAATRYWINVGHYHGLADHTEDSFKIALSLSAGATLGVDELDELLNVSLFPNPTSNLLNIINKDNIDAVSIHNLLGQEVLNEFPNKSNTQIDMSILPSGMYVVTVLTQDKRSSYRILKR